MEKIYKKNGDFDILTQNSILVKFDLDFILEILYLRISKHGDFNAWV